MVGATLTTLHKSPHSSHCNACCRRERTQKLVASSSRPFVDAGPRRRAASTTARAAEPATLEQPGSTDGDQTIDEPVKRSFDSAELNQLARMMPDPAEDELFEDGRSDDSGREDDKELFRQQGLYSDLLLQGDSFFNSNYLDQCDQDLGMAGADYGYPDDLEEEVPDLDPREIERGLAQAQFDYSARKRWELEQAEARALELHHEQIGRGVNRFAQAIRLAVHMENVEQTDNLAGLESTSTPSWIRAHFRLEDEWEDFAQHVHEVEQQHDRQESKNIEEAAMLMLDEDESFWRDECDEPVVQKPAAGAGQKPAIRREAPPPGREVRGPDADIDKYLGALPGVQDLFSEKDFVNQMLGGPRAVTDPSLEDSVDEDED